MSWQMIKLDLRKVAVGYFMFLVAFVAYVLFQPKPLKAADPIALSGGMGLAGFLAWRIFHDSCSTESFVFSRPVSRSRLFRQRWLLGLFLQMATLALIACVVCIGGRCWVHAGGPYHPMVKWYELNILWPIAISAPLVYSLTIFAMLRNRLNRRKTQSSTKRTIARVVLALILVGLCIPFLLVVGSMPIGAIPKEGGWLALSYEILFITLTTWASRDCFVKMEVRS